MTLKASAIDRLKALVLNSDHIVVLQPERIDPDSVGSATALTQLLEDQKKRVTNFAYYPGLKGIDEVFETPKLTNQLPKSWDLTILVDCGGPPQLADTFKKHLDDFKQRPFVVIDHHAKRTAMPFESIELVDNKAAATGQQIFEIADYLKWPLTKNSSLAIATAIVTDTLSLSTEGVSSHTLKVMAQLIENGVNLEKLRIDLEQSYASSPSELPMKVELLKRTKFYFDDKIALTYLTLEEHQKLGVDSPMADGLKQELRRLKGVQAAAVITEKEPKKYKVSFRSNLPVAGAVATQLGGGGHDKAASGYIEGQDIEEIMKHIAKLLETEIKKHES